MAVGMGIFRTLAGISSRVLMHRAARGPQKCPRAPGPNFSGPASPREARPPLSTTAPVSHARRSTPSPVCFRRCRGDRPPATVSQGAIEPLVVIVIPATSISFFRPEFDDFLHAPIGMERNAMPLSVLSALARLDLDPWKEAAELSELSRDCATQRLAALIARLPGGRWTQAEARGIAHHLIEFLPSGSTSELPLTEKAHGILRMTASPAAKMLICAALVGVGLISAASCEPSFGADAVAFRTTVTVPHHPAHGYIRKVTRD
jgi:hypothetical protein